MTSKRPWPQRRRLMAALPLAASAAVRAQAPAAARIVARRIKTSDGVGLNVLVAAPPVAGAGAPTVVFVPGWCMPASIWRTQLEALGTRMDTLAFDPRGQGDSDVPDGGYDIERRVLDLHEVIEPLPRVVLVGWSLGGLEALHYAHRFGTERLAGMVLVDNSVGEPPAPRPSNFTTDLRADRRRALERFVPAMFARAPARELIDSIMASAQRMPLEAAVALLSYPLPRSHWREIARALPRPLCYCVTPQFRLQANNLRAERPATRIELFERAGHALFVDEPDRFNRIVAEFAAAAA